MHSNDLRAMNGFDIEDIAGENGRFRHMECIELNNGLFESFYTGITASFKALFRLSSHMLSMFERTFFWISSRCYRYAILK